MLARLGRILLWILGGLVALALVLVVVGIVVLRGLIYPDTSRFGTVEDEARRAGRSVESLPGAGDPYYAAMDKGLLLPPAAGAAYPPEILDVAGDTQLDPEAVRQAAIRGQNMWMIWTGGNDRFWDFAARTAIGSFDLLKTISSHPSQAYGHENRFRYLGVVNEPCFEAPDGPDPTHFGLWIDRRSAECPPDPFVDPATYPGIKIPADRLNRGEVDARGETMPAEVAERFADSLDDGRLPVGSYYGEPTGVVGLRLFPNPDFDAEAARRWDPERFYTDPDYYNDANLVRPYRVGMACAFCHTGPSPVNPPAEVEKPGWPNLAGNPGAQYYWVDRIFFWNTEPRREKGVPAPNEGNFLFQLFHTNPPGTLDTSLVSTDYMNNPRTMNAVYELRARLGIALKTGIEQLEGGERDNRQFQDYPATQALAPFYDPATGKVASMRVLKDGADSVGGLGALNRVYLNIGLFSEEWLLHFRPFIGGRKISPIAIADAERNSVFWQATEAQTVDMAIYFLVTARADRLKDAPGGAAILTRDPPDLVEHGMVVFARTCAACHSSRQPEPDPTYGVDAGICEGGGTGPQYRECWDRFWAWAQSDAFKTKMTEMVLDGGDDFLTGNYLSTDRRVPLDLLGTNACSAIATNGLRGDIWDNFTSQTYKSLPPPGPVTVQHPVSGADMPFQSLGNGRGYIRPASLVSLWSTAPYMLNNSVGYEHSYRGADYYHASGEDEGRDYGVAADPGGAAAAEADEYSAAAAEEYNSATSSGAYGATAETAAITPYEEERSGYGGGYTAGHCPSSDPDDPFLPCVENRVALFDASIRAMISPDLRRKDDITAEPVPGYIYRTSAPSCLIVPPDFVPAPLKRFTGLLHRLVPWAVTEAGGVALGPFPEGFPINALANTKILPDNDEPDMLAHLMNLARSGPTLLSAFRQLGGQCSPVELADPEVRHHADEVVRDTGMIDALVGLSKCPDYVVNKGHTFGVALSVADREALIAYLKRF
ncbi:MAG: hypothetical protein KDA73_11385 [Rhodobacteraceae bacterium]|nr:hypothetical protein [Paracoccaceae bacterium]